MDRCSPLWKLEYANNENAIATLLVDELRQLGMKSVEISPQKNWKNFPVDGYGLSICIPFEAKPIDDDLPDLVLTEKKEGRIRWREVDVSWRTPHGLSSYPLARGTKETDYFAIIFDIEFGH